MELIFIGLLLYVSFAVFTIAEYKHLHGEEKITRQDFIPVYGPYTLLVRMGKPTKFLVWTTIMYVTYVFAETVLLFQDAALELFALIFLLVTIVLYFVQGYKFMRDYIKQLGEDRVGVFYFSFFPFVGMIYYGIKITLRDRRANKTKLKTDNGNT